MRENPLGLPPAPDSLPHAATRFCFIFRFPPTRCTHDYRTDRELPEKQFPSGAEFRLDYSLPCFYFSLTISRLLVTPKTPETELARIPAMFLSASLSTTPSSVTFPFLTRIRIGLMTGMAYFSIAGKP